MNVIIRNCKNIKSADLNIIDGEINIKYGMNGTGKSTISEAIKLASSGNSLGQIKSYEFNEEPEIQLSNKDINVEVFNENFINSILYKEESLIENSFEVFIENDEYRELKTELSSNKKNFLIDKMIYSRIADIIIPFKDVMSIIEDSKLLDKKISISRRLNNGLISRRDLSQYENDKRKSRILLSKLVLLLTKMDSLIPTQLVDKLSHYKENYNDIEISLEVGKLYKEIETFIHHVERFREVELFIKRNRLLEEAEKLLRDLYFKTKFEYINGIKIETIVDEINARVISKADKIKSAIISNGKLNTYIKKAINSSKNDINEFMKNAGINYRFKINKKNDEEIETLLLFGNESSNIVIKYPHKNLSWGEKNAISLILFKFYALSKNADVIIFDDPMSSFDNNKKYAILENLFRKSSKSLLGRTVLFLTHDLEPIIDFIVNNKPTGHKVNAGYLRNIEGMIREKRILKNHIKSEISILREISSNYNINIVSRLCALRKYMEHHINEKPENAIIYNIISSLLHNYKTPVYKNNREIKGKDFDLTLKELKKYIKSFNYKNIYNILNSDNLLTNMYFNEEIPLFKLQIYRVLLEKGDLRKIYKDSKRALLKYIDQTLHIENEYMYDLDVFKFDKVPLYIQKECDTCMIEFKANLENSILEIAASDDNS